MEAQELLDKLNDPALRSLLENPSEPENWPSRLASARRHLEWVSKESSIQMERIGSKYDGRNAYEKQKQREAQEPHQLIADLCRSLSFALLKDEPDAIRANWVDYGRYLWDEKGTWQILSADDYVLKKRQQVLDRLNDEKEALSGEHERKYLIAKKDAQKRLEKLEERLREKSGSHAEIISGQQAILDKLIEKRPLFLSGPGLFTSFILYPVVILFIPTVLYLFLVIESTSEDHPNGLIGSLNSVINWPLFFAVLITAYALCVTVITIFKVYFYLKLRPQIERETKKLNQIKLKASEFRRKADSALEVEAEAINSQLQTQLSEIQERSQLETSQIEVRHKQEFAEFEQQVPMLLTS